MSIPDVVSTSFKLGPGGAAGVTGSSAANATPDVAKLSISAGAINCLRFFILFIPHTFEYCETSKSRAKHRGSGCAVATGSRLRRRGWLLHSFPVARNVQAFAL